MKKIYLLSNPSDGFTNFVGNNLFNDLKNYNNKIVFLPCNYLQEESNAKYHIINTSWFEKYGINFSKNTMLNIEMSEEEIKHYLSEANVLFIMGGKQLEQMKFCYIKNIVDDITNFNGIIVGICAGAINMSNAVTSLYLSGMNNPIQTYYEGFSLVDFNILPHIKDKSKLQINNNNYIILDDNSSIIIENGKYKYDGEYLTLRYPMQNYFLKKELTNYDGTVLKKDIEIILINLVFIICNDSFKTFTDAQIIECKQMFKYVILNMNMDYDRFIKNVNIIKESYRIKGVPDNMFLYKEFIAIKNSIRLARKFVNSNKDKLKIVEISNIIYDRYGVKYDELFKE